jgi:hypothetical protein
MNSNHRHPNFLYIGATRTGSTWLYTILGRHPQIYLPAAKDIWFFDREYHRGLEWYETFFEGATQEHKAVGEVSHYLFGGDNAERIYNYNPNMKFIVNFRDPIERLISYYHFMTKRAGQNYGSLMEFSEKDPIAVQERYYATCLNKFLNYFSPEQFLVLDFDLIESNPDEYLSTVFSFLGCDPLFIPQDVLRQKIFENKEPHLKSVSFLLFHSAQVARKVGLQTLVGKLKHSKILEHLLYRPQKPKLKIEESERDYLLNLFKLEIEELQKILPTLPNKKGEFGWLEDYTRSHQR